MDSVTVLSLLLQDEEEHDSEVKKLHAELTEVKHSLHVSSRLYDFGMTVSGLHVDNSVTNTACHVGLTEVKHSLHVSFRLACGD